ncbi:uncharacterized protein KY384_001553 [Bacidia gigantensis]|uniref:uncharacterized protein n=1 Tax=Bacidia gigantensis TaxID=2732470 RepID=UPI001D048A4C|nr:uncharacterized protein KY384_001553 [Bacidia gigantensis]KAG8533812.1 hypothetical protein KY384_001553 [Bacidia gigantensis]
MDSCALLRSQGWLGTGYSLNREAGRGLRNPIKVQPKNDVLGMGKKKHEALTHQWWATGFDDVLKSVNASEQETTTNLRETPLAHQSARVTFHSSRVSNLYSSFVKGESLEGTITSTAKDTQRPIEHSKDSNISDMSKSNIPKGAYKVDDRGTKRKRRRAEEDDVAKEVSQEGLIVGSFDSVEQFVGQAAHRTMQDASQRKKVKRRARKAARACKKVI